MNNVLYWIWLTQKISSSRKIAEITEYFGGAENIYNCGQDELVRHVRSDVARALCDKSLEAAEKIYEDTVKCGAFVVTIDDEEYPDALKKIYDPPHVLYARGNLFGLENAVCVGVVGTRMCDDYGMRVTYDICRGLARNKVMIISGLANGVDSVAANAALDAGMPTIAVIGNGIDSVYPPNNEKLFKRIEKYGTILSEYPPGFGIRKWTFPQRNRIISGLSDGVLVTQAPERSGALITAHEAMENGRDVFSVPGNISNTNCIGSNKLIKDGATPVFDAQDILNEYPGYETMKPVLLRQFIPRGEDVEEVETKKVKVSPGSPVIPGITPEQMPICECIANGLYHIDDIARELSMPVNLLSSELVMLEISGVVESLPGNKYELTINRHEV